MFRQQKQQVAANKNKHNPSWQPYIAESESERKRGGDRNPKKICGMDTLFNTKLKIPINKLELFRKRVNKQING